MLINKDDERGRCNLNNIMNLLIRTFCLIVLPLLNLAIIITLWPGFISFGNPFLDNFELRSLLIAICGGGIGAFLDLIIGYYIILSGCNDAGFFKINISFSVRIIIGIIMGFLVYFFLVFSFTLFSDIIFSSSRFSENELS